MNKYTIGLLIVGAFLIVGGSVSGQRVTYQSARTGSVAPASSLTGSWTADIRPYKQVLEAMKAEFSRGKSPQEITLKYKALALSHSSDPVAQLAYIAAQRGENIAAGKPVPFVLNEDLAKADPGNSYEYARYRFCISDETNIQTPIQGIKAVGRRLLDYNHSDNWVRLSMINQLCNYTAGAEQALPYASAWVAQEPKSGSSHSALALVYFDMWQASHRKDHALARKALMEYQTYLRLASPSDKFRKPAEAYIKNIQRIEAQQG